MPRPPILPTIDWKSVHKSGKRFTEWIQTGESQENREKILRLVDAIVLEPQVHAELQALSRTVNVIAVAEDWCGDVVRHVPVLRKVAEAAPHLKVRYITREQHPEIFVRFLTNGGEAIPQFIFLNDQFVECGHWGPMPEACRRIIARGKACSDMVTAREKVAKMYEADFDCETVIEELVALIEIASCTAP